MAQKVPPGRLIGIAFSEGHRNMTFTNICGIYEKVEMVRVKGRGNVTEVIQSYELGPAVYKHDPHAGLPLDVLAGLWPHLVGLLTKAGEP